MKISENLERLKDPKFYLENFTKIKGKKPGALIPFILNEAQKDLFNTVRTNNRIIINKSRQIGFSTAMVGYFYHNTITTPGTTTAIIGYNSDLTSELLDKVKTFYRSTPASLKPTIQYNSKYEISFPRLDSKILVLPSTVNVGRGYTLSQVLATELSSWENAEEKMMTLEASVPINGKLVIESTPKGAQGLYHRMWMAEDNGYIKKEYGWHWGYSDAEIEIIRKRMNNPSKFAQEYLCSFLASGRAVFDPYMIKEQRKNIWKVGEEHKQNGEVYKVEEVDHLRIYKKPVTGGMYVAGCLPDGEKVLTNDGLKDIEDVNFNDLLINKNGDEVEIKNIQRRYYEGNIIEIKPNYTSISTKFTPDHPVLVLRDNKIHRACKRLGGERYYNNSVRWKKIKDITNKDIFKIPIRFIKFLSGSEIISHFPCQDNIRIDRRVNPEIILKEDFWFFMGLWLAEGWVRKDKVGRNSITLHLNGYTEYELAKRIQSICKKLFNRNFSLNKRKDRQNTFDLKLSSEVIYEFIINNFGQKSKNKDIKEWIKYLPINLKLALFEGYRTGDGCEVKTKEGLKINCVSISEKLLYDFQEILLSVGILSSVKVLREAGYHFIVKKESYCQKTFELNLSVRDSDKILKNNVKFKRKRHKHYGWVEDGFLYAKIAKIKKSYYEGYVNNFETKTHSYQSPFIITHNCDVSEGVEGGDYSFVTIWNRTTGEEVAMFRGLIPPDRFADKLYDWGMKYNKALMVVEINNHGLTTLTCLKQKIYPSLYFRPKKIDSLGVSSSDKFGWRTTKVTRPLLIDEFAQACRDEEVIVHSKELLDEMSVFIYDDNGNMVPGSGFHDDGIFAAGIAWQGFKLMPKTELRQLDYSKHLPTSFAY